MSKRMIDPKQTLKDEKQKRPVFTLVSYDFVYSLSQLVTEMYLEDIARKELDQPQGTS